jgi:hypothetical protein
MFFSENTIGDPNDLGVPPARKKGQQQSGQRPFSCLLSGYPRYFGS